MELLTQCIKKPNQLKTTKNKLIHIGCPIPFDTDQFLDKLSDLLLVASRNEEDKIRPMVKDMVVTYQYPYDVEAVSATNIDKEKTAAVLT